MNSTPSSMEQMRVTGLKGVGPGIATRLGKLAIHTLQDLLFHLPIRYEDRTRLTLIADLKPGGEAVVEATIVASQIVFARRRSLVTVLQDGTGSISMRLFHFSRLQQSNLEVGRKVRCFGEARRGASGLELYHPQYRVLKEDQSVPLDRHYTPVYPTTAGITQARLRSFVDQALDLLLQGSLLQDWMPPPHQSQQRLSRHCQRHRVCTPAAHGCAAGSTAGENTPGPATFGV